MNYTHKLFKLIYDLSLENSTIESPLESTVNMKMRNFYKIVLKIMQVQFIAMFLNLYIFMLLLQHGKVFEEKDDFCAHYENFVFLAIT